MNDEAKPVKKRAVKKAANRPACFVMMPIGGRPERPATHWRAVYEQIFVPAIDKAGYDPHLGSRTLETNIIQLDVLKRIIEAPMALCDISTHNPNVLFELGIRQAFDKPVVLVAEEGTENIFDISPLRYQPYRSARLYDEVIQDQENITNVIKATKEAVEKGSINSLIRLLALQPAELPKEGKGDIENMLKLILAQVSEQPQPQVINTLMRSLFRDVETGSEPLSIIATDDVRYNRKASLDFICDVCNVKKDRAIPIYFNIVRHTGRSEAQIDKELFAIAQATDDTMIRYQLLSKSYPGVKIYRRGTNEP